ncbi:MAG: hypothetical protein JXL97_08605 [Bacteroidales bacterium]|nr:hypothetical protein [Bacteroidales bacterium]
MNQYSKILEIKDIKLPASVENTILVKYNADLTKDHPQRIMERLLRNLKQDYGIEEKEVKYGETNKNNFDKGNIIDPHGLLNLFLKDVKKRKKNLNNENEINALVKNKPLSVYEDTLNEIDYIKNSYQDFEFKLVNAFSIIAKRNTILGGTYYDIDKKRIIVELETVKNIDFALLSHELVHCYQFLTGKISFNKKDGGVGKLYDVYDEIEAYSRESYIKEGLFGHDYSKNEILNMKDNFGNKIYRNISKRELSISSVKKYYTNNLIPNFEDYLKNEIIYTI